jgi:DNA-binding FadR family transcriptional regulator
MVNDATFRPNVIDSARVKTSRVAQVVAALEELSLRAEEGDLLGSEAELLDRFGVSRPTLRQAAKVVEAERLITVRRGLHGGFYVARPTAPDAIRTAALYLRLQGAGIHHTFEISRMLSAEIAAIAATCTDAGLREELAAIRDELRRTTGATTRVKEFIAQDLRFMGHVAKMAPNPIMMLFWQIGVEFGGMERELSLPWTPENRAKMRVLRQHPRRRPRTVAVDHAAASAPAHPMAGREPADPPAACSRCEMKSRA